MSDENKFILTPKDEALFRFDAENNVEPPRRIARRIAMKWDINQRHPIVDDIAHAIEDAVEMGQKRGKFL